MRLLLTPDPHRDGKKLLWFLDKAPEHDALLVAGDLLDIFSNTDFKVQTGREPMEGSLPKVRQIPRLVEWEPRFLPWRPHPDVRDQHNPLACSFPNGTTIEMNSDESCPRNSMGRFNRKLFTD